MLGNRRQRNQTGAVDEAEWAVELVLFANVDDEEAFEMTRRMASQEGIFAGMSSGAAVVGACKAAIEMTGGTLVVLVPDRGDRYLSTNLFRSVCGKCRP